MLVRDPKSSRDIVSQYIMSSSTWESEFLLNMKNFLQLAKIRNPDSQIVLLDIGANLGLYSFLAAKLGYKVYAFEPMNENIDAMRYMMCKDNDLARNIVLLEYGLGETEEECDLIIHHTNSQDGVV